MVRPSTANGPPPVWLLPVPGWSASLAAVEAQAVIIARQGGRIANSHIRRRQARVSRVGRECGLQRQEKITPGWPLRSSPSRCCSLNVAASPVATSPSWFLAGSVLLAKVQQGSQFTTAEEAAEIGDIAAGAGRADDKPGAVAGVCPGVQLLLW